jgi:hypothetical protein
VELHFPAYLSWDDFQPEKVCVGVQERIFGKLLENQKLKLTVSQSDLSAKLSLLSRIVPNNRSHPVLANV